jgi:hypothetical protein
MVNSTGSSLKIGRLRGGVEDAEVVRPQAATSADARTEGREGWAAGCLGEEGSRKEWNFEARTVDLAPRRERGCPRLLDPDSTSKTAPRLEANQSI